MVTVALRTPSPPSNLGRLDRHDHWGIPDWNDESAMLNERELMEIVQGRGHKKNVGNYFSIDTEVLYDAYLHVVQA